MHKILASFRYGACFNTVSTSLSVSHLYMVSVYVTTRFYSTQIMGSHQNCFRYLVSETPGVFSF